MSIFDEKQQRNDDKHTNHYEKPQTLAGKLNQIYESPYPKVLKPLKVLVSERADTRGEVNDSVIPGGHEISPENVDLTQYFDKMTRKYRFVRYKCMI